VEEVPSLGQLTVGGGVAVYIVPLTVPSLTVVSVYVHPEADGGGVYATVVSWNPVTVVEAPVVVIFPFTTV
jgi:hypothetical protein